MTKKNSRFRLSGGIEELSSLLDEADKVEESSKKGTNDPKSTFTTDDGETVKMKRDKHPLANKDVNKRDRKHRM